jgi:hypothetical protein
MRVRSTRIDQTHFPVRTTNDSTSRALLDQLRVFISYLDPLIIFSKSFEISFEYLFVSYLELAWLGLFKIDRSTLNFKNPSLGLSWRGSSKEYVTFDWILVSPIESSTLPNDMPKEMEIFL